MGNTLVNNWNDTQHTIYDAKSQASWAFLMSFSVAATQYVVTQWILSSSKMNKATSPVTSNAFVKLTCLIVCWIIWSLLSFIPPDGSVPKSVKTGYYVATYVTVFLGVPFQLLVCWLCSKWRGNSDYSQGGNNDEENSHQDIEEGPAEAIPNPDNKIDIDGTLVTLKPTLEESSDDDDDETTTDKGAHVTVATPTLPNAATGKANAKPTVHYINNIKIFLTHIVILHHVIIAVGGDTWGGVPVPKLVTKNEDSWSYSILNTIINIDSSYFMNLFFFYSGYFVPKSFDKKGWYSFLFERVKRLGIPFVVYNFFVGPFIESGFVHILFASRGDAFHPPIADGGPTWFLAQLMVFSSVYAVAFGKGWYPKAKCPSLIMFLAISIGIGFATGVLCLFFPEGDSRYFNVPNFWRHQPSYPLYFFGGALAQRNDWMECIKKKSRIVIYLWTIAILTLYVLGVHDVIPVSKLSLVPSEFVSKIITSIRGMAFSLAVTVFFMDFVNRKFSSVTDFYSKSMYTAYIIQFAFPLPLAYKFWVMIVDRVGSLEKGYEGGSWYFVTNENLLIPGYLFVGAVTMILIWPLSYGIRSIPGFSQVL
jgi:glucan biosynthesis protein C